MPARKNVKAKNKNGNGGTLGIENELWEAADKLRGHLDAAEYKSVVLGLIFLKYVSDMFEQVRARVEKEAVASWIPTPVRPAMGQAGRIF